MLCVYVCHNADVLDGREPREPCQRRGFERLHAEGVEGEAGGARAGGEPAAEERVGLEHESEEGREAPGGAVHRRFEQGVCIPSMI